VVCGRVGAAFRQRMEALGVRVRYDERLCSGLEGIPPLPTPESGQGGLPLCAPPEKRSSARVRDNLVGAPRGRLGGP